MERYTSLYRLPENQYTAGSPVLLEAGALLKDSRTGAVLVQLKMRSVSAKPIRAVMVAVDAFDVSGAPLEGVAEYQYLDLSVPRDEPFGQHQAIVLPDANTRRASVRCTRVVFADGTSWEADPSAVWSPLPERTTLEEALSQELAEQYRRDTAACAQMLPQRCGSLWSCACGALNSAEEKVCHRCSLSLDAQLAALDETVLREHLAAYKEAEAKKAEELCRREKERQAERRRKTKKTLAIALPAATVCAAAVILITTVIVPNQKHKEALALIDAGDYPAAYAMLEELGKPEEIKQNKYDRAIKLLNSGDYDDAYTLLGNIGENEVIAESKYDRAMKLIDAGDYDDAYTLLRNIGNNEAVAANKYDRAMAYINAQDYEAAYTLLDGLNYEDSEEKRESIKPQYYEILLSRASAGDTVSFGSYEQDGDESNGKEEIKWIVLEKEADRILVISESVLDHQPYNTVCTDVTWSNCSLRQWLNDEFLNAAFTEQEKAAIPVVDVSADENPKYSTDPGSATQDKIFLLSIEEVSRYFSSDSARTVHPTVYAKEQGSFVEETTDNSWWWLRSPGKNRSYAASVFVNGVVNYSGYYTITGNFNQGSGVNYWGGSVRPVLWIDLTE